MNISIDLDRLKSIGLSLCWRRVKIIKDQIDFMMRLPIIPVSFPFWSPDGLGAPIVCDILCNE